MFGKKTAVLLKSTGALDDPRFRQCYNIEVAIDREADFRVDFSNPYPGFSVFLPFGVFRVFQVGSNFIGNLESGSS